MSAPSQSRLRLHGEGREGRAGRWWSATDPGGGEQRGALRLDPAAVSAAGVVDRLVSLTLTLRRRNLPGLLPIVDLVAENDQVWLLTGAPAGPTVAELLAGSRLQPAAAPGVLRDAGRALLRLHQAGLVHGAVGPDTVVVDGSGTVWLAEAGLVPALRGTPTMPAADALGWASLARALAAAQAGPPAHLLHRCAAAAEAAGLTTALNTLEAGLASPPVAAGAVPADAGRPGAPADAGRPGNDAPTQLGRRPAGPPARGFSAAGDPVAAGGELRFGPGVGAARPPAWQPPKPPGRQRRRRFSAVLSGLLTIAIAMAVGGYLWWQRENPLTVTAAVVAPAEAPDEQCDVTVDVVGTVQTNGRGGIITYQWIRSDGETTAVLDQTVPAGAASVQVHLFWSFSGEGRYDATATLKILAPSPLEASGDFTYACS